MSFKTSDDTSNLSNDEKKIYQRTVNLLKSNFQPVGEDLVEVLGVLKNIFVDSENNQKPTNTLPTSQDTYFGVLNYDKILKQANPQQLSELFQCLCTIKNIQVNDFHNMKKLFDYVIDCMFTLQKMGIIEVNWNYFVSSLNLDNLVELYKRRDIAPATKELFMSYISYFSDLSIEQRENQIPQLTLSKQNYTQHFYMEDKIKNIFYFSTKEEVLKNENLTRILHDIFSVHVPKLDHNKDIFKYIGKVFYNNNLSKNDHYKIESFIDSFENDHIYNTDLLFHNLLMAVLNKDKDLLFAATDDYLEHFWKTTKLSNDDNINHKLHFDVSSLSLEDKIVAFFTSYFNTVQPNPNMPIFITFLLTFYDKELFKSFMAHYELPYNIPVREEMIVKQDDDDIVTKQHYYSLFELLTYQEKYSIAADMLDHPTALDHFYKKIVENDTVYEYKYIPLSDMKYIDEKAILFFIHCGVINENTYLPLNITGEEQSVGEVDVFFYFIHRGYYQAFVLLYEQAKSSNPVFDLKSYQTDANLLSLYIISLQNNIDNLPNPVVLSIFINENYNLYDINNDGATPLDYIQKLPYSIGFPTVALLKPLFDKEQNSILQSNIIENTIDSLFNPKVEAPQIEWFNRTQLESHLKTMSKEKDNTSVEYIKNMLSHQNHLRKNLIIDDESFFDTLLEQFPNFKDVINFYKGQFRLRKLTGKIHIPPVLLFGDPGIGKTKFAKELAKHLETGYTFIDMGSMTANWLLTGNNGTWKNAKQGKILESIMKSNTISPLILMDELDKAKGGEYDASPALYQLLEEVNSKEFTDEFVDFTFNASGIIYISCANNINNISEPLLSRFKIFNIQKPSDAQLDSIIDNMYRESTKDTNLFEDEIDASLKKKLKNYSLRNIKVMLDDSISQALLEFSSEDLSKKVAMGEKIVLDSKYVKDLHKKATIGFTKS